MLDEYTNKLDEYCMYSDLDTQTAYIYARLKLFLKVLRYFKPLQKNSEQLYKDLNCSGPISDIFQEFIVSRKIKRLLHINKNSNQFYKAATIKLSKTSEIGIGDGNVSKYDLKKYISTNLMLVEKEFEIKNFSCFDQFSLKNIGKFYSVYTEIEYIRIEFMKYFKQKLLKLVIDNLFENVNQKRKVRNLKKPQNLPSLNQTTRFVLTNHNQFQNKNLISFLTPNNLNHEYNSSFKLKTSNYLYGGENNTINEINYSENNNKTKIFSQGENSTNENKTNNFNVTNLNKSNDLKKYSNFYNNSKKFNESLRGINDFVSTKTTNLISTNYNSHSISHKGKTTKFKHSLNSIIPENSFLKDSSLNTLSKKIGMSFNSSYNSNPLNKSVRKNNNNIFSKDVNFLIKKVYYYEDKENYNQDTGLGKITEENSPIRPKNFTKDNNKKNELKIKLSLMEKYLISTDYSMNLTYKMRKLQNLQNQSNLIFPGQDEKCFVFNEVFNNQTSLDNIRNLPRLKIRQVTKN